MFEAARRRMRSIAMIGVASALTVGGLAMAQGGSGGNVQPAERPIQATAMGKAVQGDVVRAAQPGQVPAPAEGPLRIEMSPSR